MRHVNMRHSQWGLLSLLWALLAGAFFIFIVYSIYGTFVTDDFDLLLSKIRGTSFVWILGIIETVAIVGSVVGLFILASKISKRGSRDAARGWLIMLSIAIAIIFFTRLITRGFVIIKEGIIYHALLVSSIEGFVLVIVMILALIVLLAVITRSTRGSFLTLFSGALIWTLGSGAYFLLDYLEMGSLAVGGPIAVFVVVFLIYFFRPVSARRKSLRKDFKRLKDIWTKAKKEYPKMDASLMESKFEEAKSARRFGSFTGVGYDRAMNRMDDAFQAIYDGVSSYFSDLDNKTKPIVEAFGNVRSLKADNAKITDLEEDISELGTALSSGEVEDAKDKALALKRNAQDLRDLFDSSRDFLDKAGSAMERLHKLGADDPEVEGKYGSAKKNFNKGHYKRARDHARFASEDGNSTADVFERARNLVEMLENRLNNKIDNRMFTQDVEAKLEKAKNILRGVSN